MGSSGTQQTADSRQDKERSEERSEEGRGRFQALLSFVCRLVCFVRLRPGQDRTGQDRTVDFQLANIGPGWLKY